MNASPRLLPVALLLLGLCTACRHQPPIVWASGSARYGLPLGAVTQLSTAQLSELSGWLDQQHAGWDHAPSGTPTPSDHELIRLDLMPEHGEPTSYSIYGRTDGSFYALGAVGPGMQWRFQGYSGHLAPPHMARELSAADVAALRAIVREPASEH
jgi:hypothetical protein